MILTKIIKQRVPEKFINIIEKMRNIRIESIKKVQEIQKCLLKWRLSKVEKNLLLKDKPQLTNISKNDCNCKLEDWLNDSGKFFLTPETKEKIVHLKEKMLKLEEKIQNVRKQIEENNNDNSIIKPFILNSWVSGFFSQNSYQSKKQIFILHKDLRNVSQKIIDILKGLEIKWLSMSDEEFIICLRDEITKKHIVDPPEEDE